MTQPLFLVDMPEDQDRCTEIGLSDIEIEGEPLADAETAAWIAAYCAGEPDTADADVWIAGRRQLLQLAAPRPRLVLPLAA